MDGFHVFKDPLEARKKDSCYQYGIMGLVSEDLNSLLAQLHVFQNTLHGFNLHKPRLAHLQNGMYLGAVFSEVSRLRVEKKKKKTTSTSSVRSENHQQSGQVSWSWWAGPRAQVQQNLCYTLSTSQFQEN